MHHFKSSAISMFIMLLSFATSEAAPVYSAVACTDDEFATFYQPNTTFQTNLNLLLSSLVSNATLHDGFYRTNISIGTANEVKGLFLCRGDITPSACHECVSAASVNITRRCTNQTESIIWYDECMLRYTNSSTMDNIVPATSLMSVQSVSDSNRSQFSNFLASMLNEAAEEAQNSPSGKKFATREANFSSSMKLYTLAQCTPDLSSSDCNTCLRSAISAIPSCCDGKRGARNLLPGCNIRYELYPFYNVSAISTQPQSPSSSSGIELKPGAFERTYLKL